MKIGPVTHRYDKDIDPLIERLKKTGAQQSTLRCHSITSKSAFGRLTNFLIDEFNTEPDPKLSEQPVRFDHLALGNDLQDTHIRSVTRMVSAMPNSLKTISLEGQFADESFVPLIEALAEHHDLEGLYITSPYVSKDALETLARHASCWPNLKTLKFHKCDLRDDEAPTFVQLIQQLPNLQDLNISRNAFGDEGITTIAKALPELPRLRQFNCEYNPFGEDGFVALAENIGQCRNVELIHLVELHTTRITPPAADAFDKHFVGNDLPNLVFVHGGTLTSNVEKLKSHNWEMAGKCSEVVASFSPENPGTPEDWWETTRRLPSIEWYNWRQYPRTQQAEAVRKNYGAFYDFIEMLPRPYINAPSISASLQDKRGEYAPVDNPCLWLNLGSVIQQLGDRGLRFSPDDLLQEDGTPNTLLQTAIDRHCADQFFSASAWKGVPKHELQAVMDALPESESDRIQNKHQLMTQASVSAAARER